MVPLPRVLMPSLLSRYVGPKRGRRTVAASLRSARAAIAWRAFVCADLSSKCDGWAALAAAGVVFSRRRRYFQVIEESCLNKCQ